MKFRPSVFLATPLLLVAISLFAQVASQSLSPQKAKAKLDAMVEGREYPELRRLLEQVQLSKPDRDFYEGVLANRQNELLKSIALLEPVIPELKRQDPKRAAIAIRTVGDSYLKLFRYADADRTYGELIANYLKYIHAADRQSLKDDAGAFHLLKDAPPQTVQESGSFQISTHLSKVGTIDTDLNVNGVTKSWILDTGANLSVLTESAAQQMKLKLSEGTAQTQGSSGAENPLHIAIITEMKVGTAVIRNVAVLVLPDSALRVPLPSGKYQIEAILGFPVLNALGELTFTSGNELKVAAGDDESGAAIYMQQLNPLVESRVNGHDLLLFFDSGASSTALGERYYNRFPGEFASLARVHRRVAGAGGEKVIDTYQLPGVVVQIGNQSATLKNVAVNAVPVGTDFDLLYGNIGRDLTSKFSSFTLDFRAMRFRLGEALNATGQN
jgi:predicted aspartyl protease